MHKKAEIRNFSSILEQFCRGAQETSEILFNTRKGTLYLHEAYNVLFTTQITNCWHSKKSNNLMH